MKFHEYISTYMFLKQKAGLQQDCNSFYVDGLALALQANYNTGKNQFVAESWWHQADRPYYCIWPAVIPMLNFPIGVNSCGTVIWINISG